GDSKFKLNYDLDYKMLLEKEQSIGGQIFTFRLY
ncbi:MAG: hypothetical protein PWR28_1643, partial [Synergistaceae bacterium]|nr:hypothetical protein [Synergistaceae bacterium]